LGAQNGGGSLKSPPRSACRSRLCGRSLPPRSVARSTLAVAHFRLAPTSLASISATDRLSPYSSYAFIADGRIACRYRHRGRDHLGLLDPQSGRLTDLPTPYTSLQPYLRAVGDRLAFIGASPTASSAVATCMCQRVALTFWPGPRFPWTRPGCRYQSRSSSRPGTARRPTPSITHPPTLTSPGRRMPGRRCWCRPIPGRPPTPRPAWTCAPISSPAVGSPWST
jgi:hypothetical protein